MSDDFTLTTEKQKNLDALVSYCIIGLSFPTIPIIINNEKIFVILIYLSFLHYAILFTCSSECRQH